MRKKPKKTDRLGQLCDLKGVEICVAYSEGRWILTFEGIDVEPKHYTSLSYALTKANQILEKL